MSAVGIVVIGRNEGERLIACLKSLRAWSDAPIVYVDSGSTDGSIEAARALGATVVSLDMSVPFTAARARNEGARRLMAILASDYVQFVDGDCTVTPGWIEVGRAFLDAHPDVAAVAGRRRERERRASVYNRLCDLEWETAVGETDAIGGDAMLRMAALSSVGFYNEALVAGEEPELCLRLREKGWKIWRLDAEMTLHDAAMTSFRQWWKRAARAGHAFAEVSSLHRASSFRIWRRETLRALFWAALLPLALVLSLLLSPWLLLLLLAYPLQALRLWAASRRRLRADAGPFALFTVLGKFPEAVGALTFYANRITGRRSALIEYK